jgi:hypothetical protein
MYSMLHPYRLNDVNDSKAHPRYNSLPFLPSIYLHEHRCTVDHTTGKCKPARAISTLHTYAFRTKGFGMRT